MIEAVLTLLIYICILALVVYVVLWVLGTIGVPLPAQIVKIIWVIFALIVLLLLARMLLGGGGFHLALT